MPTRSAIQQSGPHIGHTCMACYTNNASTIFCTDYGIREKYLTYYTADDSNEHIHTTEELKKFSMGSDEFEDIYKRKFKYKQDVV